MLSPEIIHTIQHTLEEDLNKRGDVTSQSTIPAEATLSARIIAKQTGVVAGLDVAAATFQALEPEIRFSAHVAEGAQVTPGTLLAEVHGNARALLAAERSALNFLGRMSGIATLTHQFVQAVAGTNATILDTRKTAPGLRHIDKLAVRRGGGANHRMGLYDMILIKDNHIDFAGSLAEAVRRARAAHTDLPIEVETRTLAEVQSALDAGVERILLDNMTLEEMRAAVRLSTGRAKLEASGNVTLARVRAIAETGVDFISIGALTHSAPVFDVSMKVVKQTISAQ